MKWLTNLYDPKRSDARFHLILEIGETEQEGWARQQARLKDKIIGKPKATKTHTAERLERWGLVGVYKKDEQEEKPA